MWWVWPSTNPICHSLAQKVCHQGREKSSRSTHPYLCDLSVSVAQKHIHSQALDIVQWPQHPYAVDPTITNQNYPSTCYYPCYLPEYYCYMAEGTQKNVILVMQHLYNPQAFLSWISNALPELKQKDLRRQELFYNPSILSRARECCNAGGSLCPPTPPDLRGPIWFRCCHCKKKP